MIEKSKKSISLVLCLIFLLTCLSNVAINAEDLSPLFIGRGGTEYETLVDNLDGTLDVTSVAPGGGVKSVDAYDVNDLEVDFTFTGTTISDLPAGNQYVLSFTDIQHATPNGDDSIGFYFIMSLHSPDSGLQGIIADITPFKKPTTGVATQLTGTSRYLPLNSLTSFNITKKSSGLYTIWLSNSYYAEYTVGNQILFDDLDLSDSIPSTGVYINHYLAAGTNFADPHTMGISGNPPDMTINGFLPFGSTALEAVDTEKVRFSDPEIGQGAYTGRRVALDGLEVSLRYDGDIGDANGYLLSFSNVAGGNMLSNEVRQKGFYFVIRFHDNLGVTDENSVSSGIIIRENVKKNANGVAVAFSEQEKTTTFSEGKFLRVSDTATLVFSKQDPENQIYNMYYKDDYSQLDPLLYLQAVDLTDYIDADGCVYVNYFFADRQQPDNGLDFIFGANGTYTDAPAEEMPPIVEEGDPIILPNINGFTFKPNEVLNANAQALSYNGISLTGKSYRTAALQTISLPVDGFEFELTTGAGASSGSYYLISFSKAEDTMSRSAAYLNSGFMFTMQCASDSYSGIYNIFGWNGDTSLGAGISKRFTDDVPARMKITKDENDTYTLWYKGDTALPYESALSGLDLADCIDASGNAYFSIQLMDTMIDGDYSVTLLDYPVPHDLAQTKIDETLSLIEDDFTDNSWSDFAIARTALQDAINESQEDINDLYFDFMNALLSLENQDPIVLLYEQLVDNIENLFTEDETLISSNYQTSAWNDFIAAKEELQFWMDEGVGYDMLIVYFDDYETARQTLMASPSDVQTSDFMTLTFTFLVFSLAVILISIWRKISTIN